MGGKWGDMTSDKKKYNDNFTEGTEQYLTKNHKK